MIRVGIIANGDRWHVQRLAEAAAEAGAELVPLSFRDLLAQTTTGPSRFFSVTNHGAPPQSLPELDAIIVRAMPPGSLEQIITRMNILGQLQQQHGTLLVNPARTIEIAVDKYLCLEKVRACGIAVPATVATERASVALAVFEQMGDVVVKPLFGSRGRGVQRLSHLDQARRRFEELEANDQVICFQEFVDHGDSDLRLLVVGDRVLGMRRHRPGHWLTNLAQGAVACEHRVTTEERGLAQRVARGLGASFLGIDLLYDRNGNPLVVEVNASPGWKGLNDVVPASHDPAKLLIAWICRQLARGPDEKLELDSRENPCSQSSGA